MKKLDEPINLKKKFYDLPVVLIDEGRHQE
jgi:hypothetical protein